MSGLFHTVSSKCKEVADVAFLLDSSASIGNDYQNEKNLLKALAFELKKGGSQAGVITFSTNTKISIKLNQYHDINSFNMVSVCVFVSVFLCKVQCVCMSVCGYLCGCVLGCIKKPIFSELCAIFFCAEIS